MKYSVIFSVIFLLYIPPVAWAEEKEPADVESLNLYIENDTTAGKDKYYTSGMKLTWSSKKLSDRLLEKNRFLIDQIPCFKSPGQERFISISIGQSIYTPENLGRKDLIEDDRPYAGISYLSLGIHAKRPFRKDTVEFIAGIVGPHSFAEDCQADMHAWLALNAPEGWDNQIKDEPVLGIGYAQERVCATMPVSDTCKSDITAHFGGGIGNAATYLNGGATYRLGINLPADFSHYRIQPVSSNNADFSSQYSNTSGSKNAGMFCFVSIDTQLVFRNIVLDGNTFRDSHSVDKKPVVADIMAGLAFVKGPYRVSFAQVFRSKEFEGQKHDHVYGSLNISFLF